MDAETFKELLKELGELLGDFAEHIAIGGGVALLIYRHCLFSQIDSSVPEPAATRDFDMIIPRVLPITTEQLSTRLLEADFRHETKSLETPPVESYVGTIAKVEIEIEFLTDARARTHKTENIVVAGVSAQPLSYIEMSLAAPLSFAATDKINLRVVAPAPWMFHKALTFPRRRSREKRAKDLYGIWYTGAQLEGFSQAALQDLSSLTQEHSSKWRQRAKKNLSKWIENAASAEWELLEAQDPAKVLTRDRFRVFIEETLTL